MMDLYTLDENFRRQEHIDTFSSVIWTERFSRSGDVVLTTPPTSAMQTLLAEGTFLALDGSKEVMLLESALIEDDALKVTGNTLLEFLKHRILRTPPVISGASVRMFTSESPGRTVEEQINLLVERLIVEGGEFVESELGIDGPQQVIENLTVDWSDSDMDGPTDAITFDFGDMYSVFTQLADTYGSGLTLYLDSATEEDYSLKFKAYRGKNRTSGQALYDLVRFSPDLGSLQGTTSLRSIANYKNLAYVFPPQNLVEGGMPNTPGVAFIDDGDTATGFDLRSFMLIASDISSEDVGGSAATLLSLLNQRAKDALANNNYVKVLDGEVVPQGEYQFGVHYGLGDIIELDSGTDRQSAQVTEYIRSQDDTGQREYPTISVLS